MADNNPSPTPRETGLHPQSSSARKIRELETELKEQSKKHRLEKMQLKAELDNQLKQLRFEKLQLETTLKTTEKELVLELDERNKVDIALKSLEKKLEKYEKGDKATMPNNKYSFEQERSIKAKGYTEAFHESVESLFVSYADYTTLLLAVFIVLYVFAMESPERLEEVGNAISASFKGQTTDGLLDGGGKYMTIIERESAISNLAENYEKMKGEVEDSIKGLDLGDKVTVTTQKEGVIITLKDQITFRPGEAALLESSVPVLRKIADILKKKPDLMVEVEGHTDNVPINTARFPSNWELSTIRASNVVRFFIESEEIQAQRLTAKGLAEYHPVTGNDTPDGRATNRRVEIKIRKTTAETLGN